MGNQEQKWVLHPHLSAAFNSNYKAKALKSCFEDFQSSKQPLTKYKRKFANDNFYLNAPNLSKALNRTQKFTAFYCKAEATNLVSNPIGCLVNITTPRVNKLDMQGLHGCDSRYLHQSNKITP